jgi:hypothetical protein
MKTTKEKIINLIEDYDCSVRLYIQPYIGDMIETCEYLEMYSGGEDDWGYYEISKEEIENFEPDSLDENDIFCTFGEYWTDISGYCYCDIQVVIIDNEGEEIDISNELDDSDFISHYRDKRLEMLGL